MTVVYRCDRCKNLFQSITGIQKIRNDFLSNFFYEFDFDLCEKCAKEFIELIEEKFLIYNGEQKLIRGDDFKSEQEYAPHSAKKYSSESKNKLNNST